MALGPRILHLLAILAVLSAPAISHAHRSKHGSILIKTALVGARVTVDGHDSGLTPLWRAIPVRSGIHLVEVEKSGYRKLSQKVTVANDTVVNVDANLPSDQSLDFAMTPLAPIPVEPRVVAPAPPPHRPIALTPALFTPAPLDATVVEMEPPVEAQATVQAPPAWYEHWWVWTAAAVVIAGGVALAVEVHQRSGTAPVQGYTLGQTTLHPISGALRPLVAF